MRGMGKPSWNSVILRMTWGNLSCVFWDVEKHSEPASPRSDILIYSMDFHGAVVFPWNHEAPSVVWEIQSGSVGKGMKDFGKKWSRGSFSFIPHP